MNKTYYGLSLALTTILTASLLSACGQTAQPGNTAGASTNQGAAPAGGSKPTLIMATSADYPPYESHDTSGGKDQMVGFDIDIANDIAKDLNFNLQVNDVNFDGLIPTLQSNRADFVMAGMTPNPDRQKNVDFSTIYYEAKNTIVAKKGSPLAKPDDLNGKKVGVQLGSTQEDYAKKNLNGAQLVSLDRVPNLIQELKSNRIDAAIIEDTVAKGYTANNPDLQFNTITTAEPQGSAVAFPKGSKRVNDFNTELKKLKDSGEIDRLVKKWFG